MFTVGGSNDKPLAATFTECVVPEQKLSPHECGDENIPPNITTGKIANNKTNSAYICIL